MSSKLFLTALAALALIPCAAGQVSPDERRALIRIYESTGGPGWIRQADWLGPAGTECSWEGVTCDAEGHVIRLSLGCNHLTGSIPPEIGSLCWLEGLEMHINEVGGEIPAELGNLANLRHLELSGNQLVGRIPAELGWLDELVTLGLSGNKLHGPIPSELTRLRRMTRLGLAENPLGGTIPPAIGNLTELHQLDLTACQLSGSIPPEIGWLVQLKDLFLGHNELAGTIPREIGRLGEMSNLNLAGNRLAGKIPEEFGALASLSMLDLSGNPLSGPLPECVKRLPRLISIQLGGGDFPGAPPAQAINNWDKQLAMIEDPVDRLTIPALQAAYAGRLDEARALLRQAQELAPADSRVYLCWGSVAELAGDPEAAVQHFRQAMAVAPDDPNPTNRLMFFYLRRKEFEQAEKVMQEYLAGHPQDFFLRWSLIRAYRGMNRPDLANRQLELLQQTHPSIVYSMEKEAAAEGKEQP